jgi:hypothetical protein
MKKQQHKRHMEKCLQRAALGAAPEAYNSNQWLKIS